MSPCSAAAMRRERRPDALLLVAAAAVVLRRRDSTQMMWQIAGAALFKAATHDSGNAGAKPLEIERDVLEADATQSLADEFRAGRPGLQSSAIASAGTSTRQVSLVVVLHPQRAGIRGRARTARPGQSLPIARA